MALLELGVIGTTAWLAVVTQWPYAVRRRHLRAAKERAAYAREVARIQARYHVERLLIVCRHHGRWIVWQVSFLVPNRRRR